MQENKLTLCEAEVGTGKICREKRMPTSYWNWQGWGMYESDGKNETIIEEYRTSWLSYSEISQLAALWSEKMEEWENWRSVDIRTVNRDGLVDITRIPEDDSDGMDKEMQIRNFLKNVKNPYCFMVGDIIVKSSFIEGASLKQRLRELADGI